MTKIQREASKYKTKLCGLLDCDRCGKKNNKNNTFWMRDISDHIAICNKIIRNNPSPAQLNEMLWNLDTESRDKFPASFWAYANRDSDE